MQNIKQIVSPLLVAMLVGVPALAQESSASAEASLSGTDGTAAAAVADSPQSEPGEGGYMTKYRPEPHLLEFGMYLGMMFPSSDHNLQDENRPHMKYDPVAFEAGARIGYFPLTYLGAEVEAAMMPTDTEDNTSAGLFAMRGHVIGQYPKWSIVPFALIGGGALGTNSGSLGNDTDPAFHFGIGAKVPVDEVLSARVDLRDTMAQKNDAEDGAQTHYPELLFGLTFTLGRTKPKPPPPPDADGDGLADIVDQCPGQPGPSPTGCPPPPDADGDGVIDSDDQCPQQPGPMPEGCPPPPDTDGDGVIDPEDKCPEQAGDMPDGCPNPDPDGDGIPVDKDECPDQPETKNGYQDADGCPDELPEEVKKFTGVIQGIEFDFGKATIRPVSRKVLDAAAETLNAYPELKVLITGHTDNVGDREKNVQLSLDRANSVRTYLAGKGVQEDRITTKGAGPDQPLVENDTKANRQKNRRIEFAVVTE